MKLDRIEIKNFRSIHETTVSLDPSCRVLVGINESGKSNILKALRLLGNFKPSRNDDLREALPDEDPVEESSVRFVFKLEKSETDLVFENAAKKVLSGAKNQEIAINGSKKQSLREFCAGRTEGLYTVNILTEEKNPRYWTLGTAYKIASGWKKPTAACPADFTVDVKGETHKLAQYKLVRASDVSEVPKEYLEDAEIKDLQTLYGDSIIAIVKDALPGVLFWEYDEKNLLPGSVKIEDFSNKPNTCTPLKNMFTLAGIPSGEIKTSIESHRKGTDNQFQNYLNRIAAKTTAHFRDVWKEYRNIEFSLRLNADQIVPGVKEKNTHDFARRSDGFKRFVTFLLMISVNVKTEDLQDTLLLIDEPDASLHPSGARYLRDELIRIAKKNYVVYSTHSIFMIDSGDISRHYIVKKKDETTSIEAAQASNIADEEVLYNALGHSVFSVLKEKSIIFEGWSDKRLFNVAMSNASSTLKRKFDPVGICHAKGVGTIKAITPMIELANRFCLILSDSDKAAKEEQKKYRQAKGFGEWKIYQEVDSSINAATAEDFIKNDYLLKQINPVLTKASLPPLDSTYLPSEKDKLAAVSKWLATHGATPEQARDLLTKIKDTIFEHLKPQNVETAYTTYLTSISL